MLVSDPSRKDIEVTCREKSEGFITTVILILLPPNETTAV